MTAQVVEVNEAPAEPEQAKKSRGKIQTVAATYFAASITEVLPDSTLRR
jgi:hypothetical protein